MTTCPFPKDITPLGEGREHVSYHPEPTVERCFYQLRIDLTASP